MPSYTTRSPGQRVAAARDGVGRTRRRRDWEDAPERRRQFWKSFTSGDHRFLVLLRAARSPRQDCKGKSEGLALRRHTFFSVPRPRARASAAPTARGSSIFSAGSRPVAMSLSSVFEALPQAVERWAACHPNRGQAAMVRPVITPPRTGLWHGRNRGSQPRPVRPT